MRYYLTVNAIKNHNPNSLDAGFYIVLEALGFRRLDRWPTGSCSAWVAGDLTSNTKIDWTTLFSVAESMGVEMQITSEHN